MVKDYKAKGNNALLVDAGDAIQEQNTITLIKEKALLN